MVLGEIKFEEADRSRQAQSPKGSDPKDGSGGSSGAERFEARLASPIDRAAACVADLILFSPFAAVLVSPFRRRALEAQLLGQEKLWGETALGMILVAALAFVLYQTVFLVLWGATPGKRVMRLEVVSLWHEQTGRLRPLSAFVRAFTWCLEVALLGLPWIALYSNERRRPFHDRISDTVVLTKDHKRAAGPPTLSELTMASGLMASCLAAISLVASLVLMHGTGTKSRDERTADLEESGVLCAQVGESSREWLMRDDDKPSRLEVALTLFGAEAIDEDCLRSEADFAFWANEDRTLGYLAKAFTQADDTDLYEQYLAKVCETDNESDACGLVRILRGNEETEVSDPEEKIAQVERETNAVNVLTSVGPESQSFVRIWAIRKWMESKRPDKALELIDSLSLHKKLGFFLARERSKALWQIEKRDEARLAMRASIDALDASQRVEMARWFCFNETSEAGCSAQSRVSCGLLDAAVESADHWLAEPEVATVYLRGLSCEPELSGERLASLEPKMPDDESKTFVRALQRLAERKREEAVELFKKVASKGEKQGPYFIEANTKLVDLADDETELDSVFKTWKGIDPGEEGWDFLGGRLMERFNALSAWGKTVEVGLRLAQDEGGMKSRFAKTLVVAAYRSGNESLALGFLEKIPSREWSSTETEPSRSPASADSFSEVVRALTSLREQGGKR